MPRRQPLSTLGLLLSLGLLAGCGSGSEPPVAVAPPVPDAAAAAACARLKPALPPAVDDAQRRPTVPASDLTTAWGEPAVVLRCGVPAAAGLGPTSQLQKVNGISWFNPGTESPEAEQRETAAGARVFTTTGRVANVELTVPLGHEPAVGPLVDVAAAIAAQVPVKKKAAPKKTASKTAPKKQK